MGIFDDGERVVVFVVGQELATNSRSGKSRMGRNSTGSLDRVTNRTAIGDGIEWGADLGCPVERSLRGLRTRRPLFSRPRVRNCRMGIGASKRDGTTNLYK